MSHGLPYVLSGQPKLKKKKKKKSEGLNLVPPPILSIYSDLKFYFIYFSFTFIGSL